MYIYNMSTGDPTNFNLEEWSFVTEPADSAPGLGDLVVGEDGNITLSSITSPNVTITPIDPNSNPQQYGAQQWPGGVGQFGPQQFPLGGNGLGPSLGAQYGGVIGNNPLFNGFNFTPGAPTKEGDIRWNQIIDAAEIFNGTDWMVLITAEQLREMYAVQQKEKEIRETPNRFAMIAMDMEEVEYDSEAEAHEKEMMALTEKVVAEALKRFQASYDKYYKDKENECQLHNSDPVSGTPPSP